MMAGLQITVATRDRGEILKSSTSKGGSLIWAS